LVQGPRNVSELAETLTAKQAIVSQQLRILRMHRLVRAQHLAGRVVYHLNEPQLSHLVDCMEHCALPPLQRPLAGGVTR
jgi:DNA-binding transcriptional ArsR family regulator